MKNILKLIAIILISLACNAYAAPANGPCGGANQPPCAGMDPDNPGSAAAIASANQGVSNGEVSAPPVMGTVGQSYSHRITAANSAIINSINAGANTSGASSSFVKKPASAFFTSTCWHSTWTVSTPSSASYYSPSIKVSNETVLFCFGWKFSQILRTGECKFIGLMRTCARFTAGGHFGNCYGCSGNGNNNANGSNGSSCSDSATTLITSSSASSGCQTQSGGKTNCCPNCTPNNCLLRLCAFEDPGIPIDPNDNTTNSMIFHHRTAVGPNSQLQAAANGMLAASAAVGVIMLMTLPFVEVEPVAAPVLLVMGAVMAVLFVTGLILKLAAFITSTINYTVTQNVGCVETPLAPFPPPLCQSIQAVVPLPSVIPICGYSGDYSNYGSNPAPFNISAYQNIQTPNAATPCELSSPNANSGRNNSPDPSAPSGTVNSKYSSFETPLIRAYFNNVINLPSCLGQVGCSTGNDNNPNGKNPLYANNIIINNTTNNWLTNNYTPVTIWGSNANSAIPICSSGITSNCISVPSVAGYTGGMPLRPVYNNAIASGFTFTNTPYIANIALVLSGVNASDYADLSANQQVTMTDYTGLQRSFVASLYSSEYPSGDHLCLFEIDPQSNRVATQSYGCVPRPNMFQPSIFPCTDLSSCGYSGTATPANFPRIKFTVGTANPHTGIIGFDLTKGSPVSTCVQQDNPNPSPIPVVSPNTSSAPPCTIYGATVFDAYMTDNANTITNNGDICGNINAPTTADFVYTGQLQYVNGAYCNGGSNICLTGFTDPTKNVVAKILYTKDNNGNQVSSVSNLVSDRIIPPYIPGTNQVITSGFFDSSVNYQYSSVPSMIYFGYQDVNGNYIPNPACTTLPVSYSVSAGVTTYPTNNITCTYNGVACLASQIPSNCTYAFKATATTYTNQSTVATIGTKDANGNYIANLACSSCVIPSTIQNFPAPMPSGSCPVSGCNWAFLTPTTGVYAATSSIAIGAKDTSGNYIANPACTGCSLPSDVTSYPVSMPYCNATGNAADCAYAFLVPSVGTPSGTNSLAIGTASSAGSYVANQACLACPLPNPLPMSYPSPISCSVTGCNTLFQVPVVNNALNYYSVAFGSRNGSGNIVASPNCSSCAISANITSFPSTGACAATGCDTAFLVNGPQYPFFSVAYGTVDGSGNFSANTGCNICSLPAGANSFPVNLSSCNAKDPITNSSISCWAYQSIAANNTSVVQTISPTIQGYIVNPNTASAITYPLNYTSGPNAGQAMYGQRPANSMELGLCTPTQSPNCAATNYSNAWSAGAEGDGYANWPQVNGGTSATGTCLPGSSTASGAAPTRNCVYTQTNTPATLTCAPGANGAPASITSSTGNIQCPTYQVGWTTVNNPCIPAIAPAWWPSQFLANHNYQGAIFNQFNVNYDYLIKFMPTNNNYVPAKGEKPEKWWGTYNKKHQYTRAAYNNCHNYGANAVLDQTPRTHTDGDQEMLFITSAQWNQLWQDQFANLQWLFADKPIPAICGVFGGSSNCSSTCANPSSTYNGCYVYDVTNYVKASSVTTNLTVGLKICKYCDNVSFSLVDLSANSAKDYTNNAYIMNSNILDYYNNDGSSDVVVTNNTGRKYINHGIVVQRAGFVGNQYTAGRTPTGFIPYSTPESVSATYNFTNDTTSTYYNTSFNIKELGAKPHDDKQTDVTSLTTNCPLTAYRGTVGYPYVNTAAGVVSSNAGSYTTGTGVAYSSSQAYYIPLTSGYSGSGTNVNLSIFNSDYAQESSQYESFNSCSCASTITINSYTPGNSAANQSMFLWSSPTTYSACSNVK